MILLLLLLKASKAIGSINSSTLSISALDLLKYTCVDSPSCWVTLKSSMKVFLVGMLMLKRATNLAYKSLKPLMEFGSRLLYQAY